MSCFSFPLMCLKFHFPNHFLNVPHRLRLVIHQGSLKKISQSVLRFDQSCPSISHSVSKCSVFLSAYFPSVLSSFQSTHSSFPILHPKLMTLFLLPQFFVPLPQLLMQFTTVLPVSEGLTHCSLFTSWRIGIFCFLRFFL